MEKKITIGIDVDGVLRDNLQIMVDLYNKEFNEKMSINDVKDYKTEVTFPKIESATGKTSSEWFFQDHSNEIFLDAKPFENVAEDVKRLHKVANIIIITYQKTLKNKLQTLQWLDDNGIEYDSIAFIKDKSKVLCDYLIDDNDWNFRYNNAKYAIVINAPYNLDKDEVDIKNSCKCKYVKRFNNLHEFTEYFFKKDYITTLYENDILYLYLASLISSEHLTNPNICDNTIKVLEKMVESDIDASELDFIDKEKIKKYCLTGIEICKKDKKELEKIN